MKILAIDFGTKRIGYAVSDESCSVAFPRTSISTHPKEESLIQLAEIIKEEGISEIIIGVPLNSDNEETEMSKMARAFGRELESVSGLGVEFIDEGGSSEEALSRIPTKKDRRDKEFVNAIAAQIILERYLKKQS